MVGWHHWVNGNESEQTAKDSEVQGSLASSSPWGHKKLDTTEQQQNGQLIHQLFLLSFFWEVGVLNLLFAPSVFDILSDYIVKQLLLIVFDKSVWEKYCLHWACSLWVTQRQAFWEWFTRELPDRSNNDKPLSMGLWKNFNSILTSPGFPGGSEVKASACNAGNPGSIPGSGRSPGEGNGNPLQYSCLENPMDRGAWWAIVHRVAKSRTRLSDFKKKRRLFT